MQQNNENNFKIETRFQTYAEALNRNLKPEEIKIMRTMFFLGYGDCLNIFIPYLNNIDPSLSALALDLLQCEYKSFIDSI